MSPPFRLILLIAMTALMSFAIHSAALAQDTPSLPVLPGVRQAMEKFIADKEIAGAVTVIAAPDRLLHVEAVGLRNIEQDVPLDASAIFWIASMTKPVTGVAVAMLHEQGKLDIHNPVSKYIPEFAQVKNSRGTAAEITILHLLTHTSGLADLNPDSVPSGQWTRLEHMVPSIASQPLRFEPGERWEYCQAGINMAGRIVEIVSGKSLPDYFQDRIFAPLGMSDTGFYPSEDQSRRIAWPYQRTGDGQLVPASLDRILQNLPVTSRDRVPFANGGLFSTALDYTRFCRMLLNDGELDGRRIMKPETVQMLRTRHSGDLETGFAPGSGWGLGVCIVRQPQGVTAMLSPGTYGHGGAHGTQAWIDPVRKVALVMMVARSNFRNSDASIVREGFQQAALNALSAKGDAP